MGPRSVVFGFSMHCPDGGVDRLDLAFQEVEKFRCAFAAARLLEVAVQHLLENRDAIGVAGGRNRNRIHSRGITMKDSSHHLRLL